MGQCCGAAAGRQYYFNKIKYLIDWAHLYDARPDSVRFAGEVPGHRQRNDFNAFITQGIDFLL